MSAPRRKAEPQPWHAESVAAWEKFGENIVARRKQLKKTQAQNLKVYLPVKVGR